MAWQRGETVEETKAAVPEREFRRFAAFFAKEPFPDEKADIWFARLFVAVLAPWREKGAKELSPIDVMPDWWGEIKKPQQPQTAKDWADLFRNFARAKGGKVLDAKGNVIHDGSKRRKPRHPHKRQLPAAGGGADQRTEPPQ